MKNREIGAALDYHNRTKHSSDSVRRNPHYLDWENQPLAFKIYPRLAPLALDPHLSSSGMPALMAISTSTSRLSKRLISRVRLWRRYFSYPPVSPGAGVIRVERCLFRAAACTGALYHIDLYVVCGDLQGLEAGVYQFSPQDFSLRRLRAGDYRSVLAGASGEEPSIANAPCAILSASTFWRNAWKYQARAYRHCYWDNGTMLANLLAAAAARTIPAKLVLGFVDKAVNQLLGLDQRREGALSLVAMGYSSSNGVGLSPPLTPLVLETTQLSKTEVDYPAMREMHEASSLDSEEEVKAWREGKAQGERIKDVGRAPRLFPLQLLLDAELPQDTIEEVIVRRGSTRRFARECMSCDELSTMIDRATRAVDNDFLDREEPPLNELYLIVHAVDGLSSGAYVYRREQKALELITAGDFRREAGYLGLAQEIPADCSVNVYFLADLNRALARFGNRGYRAAQLEAAIMGGRLYLGAYAQRLGASGLTFFDDDVTEFFSPDAAGKSVMFLIALGKSAKGKNLNAV